MDTLWRSGDATQITRLDPDGGAEVQLSSESQPFSFLEAIRLAENGAKKALAPLVANFLSSSWRSEPSKPRISAEDFESITPLLLKSGAAALGWWRVRHSELRESPAAEELRSAYHLHSIQAAIHRKQIEEVISLLNAAGVEPVLVKGWAVARFYPEPGLRPFGDIDLCILPEHYLRSADVVRTLDAIEYNIDLHEGFAKLDDRRIDDLLAGSEAVCIGEAKFRVLGCEDQLRILCTHLLKHGAWRPLWLCDIGAAVESRPAGFNWERCLGKDKRRADWVACAIGLAHQLLDARVDDIPIGTRANHLPNWLIANVLKNWEQPYPELYPPLSYVPQISSYLRHPRGLLKALRTRWPDPIEATIRLKGPFNEMPRLPFQLGNALWRLGRFLTRTQKDE